MATVTDSRGRPLSGSITASIAVTFITLCALIPYALVAAGLRFVMARVFFLFGQAMIEGPALSFAWLGRAFDFSITLPADIKASTLEAFQTQYAALPLPPAVAAYFFAYALFALPICLMLGFATRFAALGLLIITVLLAVYVTPDALWTTHVYWGGILLVLISIGPGAISLDAAIRYLYEA